MMENIQTPVSPSVWESPSEFREYCAETHPATVADGLKELEAVKQLELFLTLDPKPRAEIFAHLPEEKQIELSELFEKDDLAITLQNMSPDERTDFFHILPEETQSSILPFLAWAEREDIRKLGAHDEGTAGSVMTSNYATLSPDLTVREAIEKLRQEASSKETIYTSYVIDGKRRLMGVVDLTDLILAPSSKTVFDVMQSEPVFASISEDTEEVARKIAKYDLIAIPVVDNNEALVGIITVDDIIDVSEEETTTDFQKMAPVGVIGMSIKDASYWLLFKKRIVWLLALVVANIFSGAGIAYFENTISTAVALVFFLPLLIGSGGNAGTQSSTLMIRAISTGDVKLKDWLKLIFKEVGVALMIGVAMGLAISIIGLLRGGPQIAVVVSMTMVIIVLAGSLIGVSLPFIFTRLKMDPATASGPLIASLADITGIFIYFSIANWYLGIS